MGPRGALWLMWAATEVISLAYICLCFATFKNIQWLKMNVPMANQAANRSIVTCLLSATILSIIVLVLFFVTSLVVMLKKAAFKEGLAGFGYGLLVSGSFHTALFMVLVGLVLNSATSAITYYDRATAWTRADTSMYYATFSFAFVLSFCYALLCLMYFFFRGFFRHHEPATASQGKAHTTHSTTPPA